MNRPFDLVFFTLPTNFLGSKAQVMIRTSRKSRHLIVPHFCLTPRPTTRAFALAGFGKPIKRRVISLLCLMICLVTLNVASTRAQGIITTVAGNGETGFWGNGGQAIKTPLNLGQFTGGVAVDLAGNLYIADTESHRVYQVRNGQRLTVAGSDCWVCAPEEQLLGDPHAGFSGDGGYAPGALINSPTGVCTDGVGNLYIVDNGNQRIRRVDTQRMISTVAGNGNAGYSGDEGPATSASLHFNRYTGNCAVDTAGNL